MTHLTGESVSTLFSTSQETISKRHAHPDVAAQFTDLEVSYMHTQNHNTFVQYRLAECNPETAENVVLALNGGGNNPLHNFAPFAKNILQSDANVTRFVAMYYPLHGEERNDGSVFDIPKTMEDLAQARELLHLPPETRIHLTGLSLSADQLIASIVGGQLPQEQFASVTLLSPLAIFPEGEKHTKELLTHFVGESMAARMRDRIIATIDDVTRAFELPPNMKYLAETIEQFFEQVHHYLANPIEPVNKIPRITMKWATKREILTQERRMQLAALLTPFTDQLQLSQELIPGRHGASMQPKYWNDYARAVVEGIS